MYKVCLPEVFSESVSPQTLCASCDHLILARGQIIQAERRFRSPLFSAEKFDVIKLSRLVNQAATRRLVQQRRGQGAGKDSSQTLMDLG
jgi:hypothetical protein